MRPELIAFAGLLAIGCGGQEIADNEAAANASDASANRTAASQPADAPPGNGFSVEEEQAGLAFTYSWPAAAEAIAPLRARLHAEMERKRAEAQAYVREDRRLAAQDGREAQDHYYSRVWSVAGNTARLLSLSASEETFSGGAHGNQQFHALVWDRQTSAAVRAADLLGPALAGFSPRFCTALNAERAERRGEPVPPPRDAEDNFNACPALSELVVTPTDEDGNGRFERLAVLIAPYVAGPYADGGYVIDLPFAAADIDRIPAAWRGLFEPGRSLPDREE